MERSDSVTIGYFQFSPDFGEIKRNLSVALSGLESMNAGIAVLPELPFTGYGFRDRDELLLLAEEPGDSEVVSELVSLCGRRDMHVVTGFAERAGEKCFNSALLLGPSGIEGVYRKLHLFDREKIYFDPGNLPLQVFAVRGTRIGMMVCFDWIFPEVSRTLTLLGAEILCHPANLVLDYCQKVMLTRSIENLVFSVTANRTGCEKHTSGDLAFTGKSQIVAPGGRIIHSSGPEGAEAFCTEIDLSAAREKSITSRNDVLSDRRPDYYFRLPEQT
jgi:predicted amidohydrolase